MQAKPFIKWAGGKTKLLPTLLSIFPSKVHGYYEPFIGGGSVFYAMTAANRFDRAFLNDWNKELVNCYRVVRGFPEELMTFLRAREVEYAEAPATMFEAFRNLNDYRANLWKGPIERAGLFIFLNKSCFNGLHRVNKKGQFNVPWGKKPTITSFDQDNILACSEALGGTTMLRDGDFAAAVETAEPGDLVYFDPPYVPLNPTANFTSYTEVGFGLADQQRLASLYRQLSDRGVAVVLSNSDTPLVRELYQGFDLREVQVKRAINSKGEGRGAVGELIVVSNVPKEAT
jgi:DNA adenine methylase